MPDTKRRSDESDLEESRGERDGDWAWENHLWPDDLPDADEVGFCENVAVAHDACIDALSELEDLNTGDGFACLEAGIERLAHALGTEEAGGEVDLKTVQGVEDVLRWLQRSRRLVKQLQTSEAVDQMEKAVAELRELLDEIGWSAPNESDGGSGDQEERAASSSLAGPADCERLWRGDYGHAGKAPTAESTAVKAHDRVCAAAGYSRSGGDLAHSPPEAVKSVRVAAQGLEEFLERVCRETTGGDAPFVKPSSAEYGMLEEVQEKLERAVYETTPELLAEIHRDLHQYLDKERTGEGVSGEDGVACPRYITHERDEPGEIWEPSTPHGRVERAHDEVRGALSELQKDNPSIACQLLLSSVRTITVAVEELGEQAWQRLYHEGHEATDYDALVARSVDEVAEEMGIARISFEDDPEEAEEFALRSWRRCQELKDEAEN